MWTGRGTRILHGKGTRSAGFLWAMSANQLAGAYRRARSHTLQEQTTRRHLCHSTGGRSRVNPLGRHQAPCRKCGLEEVPPPHTLRHSFATHLLQRGAIRVPFQSLLGIATSLPLKSTRTSRTALRATYDRHHPRALEPRHTTAREQRRSDRAGTRRFLHPTRSERGARIARRWFAVIT